MGKVIDIKKKLKKMKKKEEVETTVNIFKQFCKERHAEDKGKNFNTLQEIYANTELFDLSKSRSMTWKEYISIEKTRKDNKLIVKSDLLKDLSLPFDNMFCNIGRNKYETMTLQESLFIREYMPQLVTGTHNLKMYDTDFNNNEVCTVNIPFTIHPEQGYLVIGLDPFLKKWDICEGMIKGSTNVILSTIDTLCNLPSYNTYTNKDKVNNMFYPKKNGQGIRVNRPIYYVFPKAKTDEEQAEQTKAISKEHHASYTLTYSFNVRGHWRSIGEGKVGKNRNGDYKVLGYTWVKSYVKGTGDLVKRLRVLRTEE